MQVAGVLEYLPDEGCMQLSYDPEDPFFPPTAVVWPEGTKATVGLDGLTVLPPGGPPIRAGVRFTAEGYYTTPPITDVVLPAECLLGAEEIAVIQAVRDVG